MRFHLLAKEVSKEPEAIVKAGDRFYGDNILPVFTSPESISRFAEACDFGKEGDVRLVSLQPDPFQLSELVGFFEEGGYEALYFDPLPAPGGVWWTWDDTISLRDYRCSIEKIRPAFEKLKPEDAAQFLRVSHLRREGFVRWRRARAEDIAANLRAQIEEWIP